MGVTRPAPSTVAATAAATAGTVAVVLFVVRMGNDLIALMRLALRQKLLEKQKGGGQQSGLGEQKTLDGSKGDYSQEQWNEGLDLQLEESEDGKELLQLLLLSTTWNKNNII